MLSSLKQDVLDQADSGRAANLTRFFKTGKGEYGEGDVFLGLTVPQSRKIVATYRDLPLADCLKLLTSSVHEERLIALLIMVYQFSKGDAQTKKKIYTAYLAQTKCINNWDLVDLSADKIVGLYLLDKKDAFAVLKKFAQSDLLWDRRIAMIATFAFIKNQQDTLTYQIADILLHDSHDLIQKAVGWMLRESGKKVSHAHLETFLQTRYKTMPRTALRYAIERFPEEKRKKYLLGYV